MSLYAGASLGGGIWVGTTISSAVVGAFALTGALAFLVYVFVLIPLFLVLAAVVFTWQHFHPKPPLPLPSHIRYIPPVSLEKRNAWDPVGMAHYIG